MQALGSFHISPLSLAPWKFLDETLGSAALTACL